MAIQPMYRIRLDVIVTANDGTPALTGLTRDDIKTSVDLATTVWSAAGIHLEFDPLTDVEEIQSTLLNNDFPVDVHGNLILPKPPDPQIQNNPNDKARYEAAMQRRGKLVIFLRDGVDAATNPNFSSGQAEYVVMAKYMLKKPESGNTLAHELGHYFRLNHTFREDPYPLTVQAVQQRILQMFNAQTPIETVVNFFDADSSTVQDTPAEPSATVFEDAYKLQPYACGPQATLDITVHFSDGSRTYTFKPDRHNVMSYFSCRPQTISNDQIKVVRDGLEHGNRKHLITPNWERIGGKILDSPTAVSWQKDRFDILVCGTDGRVFHAAWANQWFPSPNPNDWEILGGKTTDKPAAVAWGQGRLDLFVRGTNGEVFHKTWANNAWWPSASPNDWENLGGNIVGSPTVVSWGKERLDLFARGINGEVFHKAWANNAWWPSASPNDWENLGGKTSDLPAVVAWGPGRLDLFVRGINGEVFHKAWANNAWWPSASPNDWENLGGNIVGSPTVVSWGKERLDLFARGINGEVFHKAWANNAWWPSANTDGWENLGGKTTDVPAAVAWGSGRLDLFVRGTNGEVFHKAWANNAWWPSANTDGWENLGGNIIGAPTAISWGINRLDVFVQGTDGAVYHKAWANDRWFPVP